MVVNEVGTIEATICNRCKRRLKDPVSIERGLGHICYKKVQENWLRAKTTLFPIKNIKNSKENA